MNQATTPSTVRFLRAIARPNIVSVLLLLFALFSSPVTTAAEPGESHCMMGCPTHPDVSDPPIDRSLYALMNDPDTKFARWVAYRVDKSNFDCDATVRRSWKSDPDIDPGDTLTPREYDDANVTLAVDRGHQAPLASFKCHSDAHTTNYLSNITPPFTKLNQGPWKKLEAAVRTLAKGGNDVWVMTGPLYEWPMAKLPSTNKMHAVPSAYWKVVSIKDNESIKSLAFYFYQDTPKRADYCDHVKTIDFIEAKARLDFFPAHPNQDALERAPGTLTAELGC